MFGIKAKITRCIDDSGYPSVVECCFSDAQGAIQIFRDKDAIFTTKILDRNSSYPLEGIIGCEIIERNDSTVRVNSNLPWHIESVSGETLFEVRAEQIIEFERL